ncbi:hypothetical protein GCM10011403_00120 [Pseudohongiella nitratireducens]|uniref:Exonuclease domain-containing protein n=1 Tax=Pseudohongiella nitratireducens TaxID=1768907 RepID=A0A917GHU8_9GAMM|nr:3'-5' exonuclease [Pseudohongiella nitratireducens]GGG46988.1 hypothetical protein GCM10011403_00120 [Pseudohongiella nitratireducens]
MTELIIVCDLEATCWVDGETVPIEKMEIIEIGCVLCDLGGNIEDEFSTFVRPVQHPTLSPFCTELTSITQTDVDDAPIFSEAMTLLDDWAANRHTMWGSWGFYDCRLLLSEQERNGVQSSYMRMPHINLKKAWRRTTKQRRQNGLAAALRYHELTFEGVPHRAIADAQNTTRLLKFIPYSEIELQLPPTSDTSESPRNKEQE